ncbi:cysteine-rich receptor-like protein kinase 2 [Amborella trichopoda]|uniref:Protein kinase domain-containing protein n=1 Tax=Amborella trichopoda TaxID=13333 RepID=W1P581_AMBTC|nr:cysteine-rich receptor-like protein kinase 2 [Amborella trichopoda]ERN02726.1 hypothetical protein AMTR_s00085p00159370 [Amborella trichopoda]|eukprot:XP_006841051.3 cysteine-rich receptor-like protein kinase 2 [Amborella trichopoda]
MEQPSIISRPLLPLLVLLLVLQFLYTGHGDSRSHSIRLICGLKPEHNASLYVPNFVSTMEKISDQIRVNRSNFGLAITGSGPDTSFAMAQCYGDLTPNDCILCYAEARTLLPQCFPVNGGRIFLDGCFMRGENYSFFGEFSGPNDTHICGNLSKPGSEFRSAAQRVVQRVVLEAPGNMGFGRGSEGVNNASVYVLGNCWRTLNESACRACLGSAARAVLGCLPMSEGRALYTGCFLRYSDFDFLNNVTAATGGQSRGNMVAMVVGIVSAVAALALGVVLALFIFKRRKIQKKRRGSNYGTKLTPSLYNSSLNFKYSTLEKATGSFDPANKLGQGGFGSVYKGVLGDGREVAVKRLFFNNRHRAADFYNEINIISSVQHKNLVKLLGCSCSGPESLLVYEFVPNRSLDRFLFEPEVAKELDWEKRMEIITGTAEGLAYLHEECEIKIIHRDIKASNILLDSRLRPKIADFGLARSFQENLSHISTAIAGTLGYMAPEYIAHGHLTEKADVYSFGVLLLEIVSGKQNNRSKSVEYMDSLLTAAWKHFQSNTVEGLIDPIIYSNNNENVKAEILRVVHVALLCTQEVPTLRPSMLKALQLLVKKEQNLALPTSPPFIDEKTMEYSDATDGPPRPLYPSSATVSYSEVYPR